MNATRCNEFRRWLRRESLAILDDEIRLQFNIYAFMLPMTLQEMGEIAPDAAATLECNELELMRAVEAWRALPDTEKLKMLRPTPRTELDLDLISSSQKKSRSGKR